ncbi:UDP-N-acetylmuramoyl-L-alanyl-D-glutamate--LD-lysine ligase [Enhygromyxa salina]|uniref:UDP-N-acetylmuramoyl-L-alanyl-D-glutamate--LD-lysine ligase n=1 Tax=Enhygromyxa salina TaxID=215803 RepID=A0A2S9YL87_9BACT|nr:UDP-N-acetylmuramyl-tripeptide synthetase [Enhygromyxa salina]PRQ05863.1 UDP-N-acetylmuramoyl-L-alanyl-D-glutamate--LD-lysine ligase [Enhygromyxa salina]
MNPYPPPPSWAAEIASVGVTGTNGKSSTTRFVAAGLGVGTPGPVGRVTTVAAAIGDQAGPPPADHQGFLALMQRLRERGGRRAAIEATSAALGLGFSRAWPFHVGVFTNLGHDHQRTHGSFEHYLASKAQLFVALADGGAAVLNAQDPASSLIAEVLPASVRALWFAGPSEARDRAVDLRVLRATPSWAGLELELEASASLGPIPAALCLRALPAFQAPNAAAALLACVALGIPGPDAANAIAECEPPRGRFEALNPNDDARPRVVVDYAHTPEALTAALASARRLCRGRVVLVVGAGGDTDASKRRPLGAAASAADLVWLTNDNPRHEDPRAIVDELRLGLGEVEDRVELDRGAAVARAIAAAVPGDLVLIAGKGHEEVQEIGPARLPSSDHALALAALENWAKARP